MEKEKVTELLTKISNEKRSSIRKEVAREALSYGDNAPVNFFCDLLKYGCASGMVSSLIYYRDTHAFFLRFYDQIEELRVDVEESIGQPLKPNGDLMNWYSWFAFEETSKHLAEEIGILELIKS
tara:strand:- start:727751 stop:728122 length:372 start_codon:yes stop_codon:yes gene_type:complete